MESAERQRRPVAPDGGPVGYPGNPTTRGKLTPLTDCGILEHLVALACGATRHMPEHLVV